MYAASSPGPTYIVYSQLFNMLQAEVQFCCEMLKGWEEPADEDNTIIVAPDWGCGVNLWERVLLPSQLLPLSVLLIHVHL